jgi:hypothetical protein
MILGRVSGVLACALAALHLVACDGDGPGRADAGVADAGIGDVAAALDGAGGDVGGAGGGEAGGAGGDASPFDAPAPSGLPLPPGVRPPTRFLDTGAGLTGLGYTGCSHDWPLGVGGGAASKSDRWCAFMKKAAAGTELWVVNVTRIAAGEAAPCDGSSAGCRRLTESLWTSPAVVGGPVHPFAHEFYGDTLLYYADALSADGQLHRGPVYVWRPGWAQPRRISGPHAIACWLHPRAVPLAYCLDDLTGSATQPTTFDLRAGPIGDGSADVVLPSLGSVHPYRNGNIPAMQAAFTSAGDRFLFSSADPDPSVEALRIIATDQIGKTAPTEILRDATSWQVAHSEQGIYFSRERGEQRTLLYADFPSGGNATELATNVHAYLVLGAGDRDLGLAFVTQLDPTHIGLRLLRDLRQPATATTVFSLPDDDMIEALELSPDTRFTAWADGGFNLRVVRNSDLTVCDLNTERRHDAFSPAYLKSAGLVFWRETSDSNQFDDRLDGWYANPDGCTGKRRFAYGVDFLLPVGDKALLFGDEFDGREFTVTLKYASLAGGLQSDWPAGAVRIRGGVDNTSVFMVGEDPRLLVFRVRAGGPTQEGTYVFGPAPF